MCTFSLYIIIERMCRNSEFIIWLVKLGLLNLVEQMLPPEPSAGSTFEAQLVRQVEGLMFSGTWAIGC